jgi:hypothetical protein
MTTGSTGVLNKLRAVFRGQELPKDATQADIMFYVNEFIEQSMWGHDWVPTRVQFVGPGSPAEDRLYRKDRITLCFGVIADGRRVIEDFSIG